jgi:mono/diheme cytochrome c family protein
LRAAALLGLSCACGCHQDMFNQAKTKPLTESAFFADGRASRPPVEDTIPQGHRRSDELLYTGKVGGVLSNEFPFPVTREVLDRGELVFNIQCSVCHGKLGDGDGMIVQRGFKRPPSFLLDRLRSAPAGHFFDVMTNGFGAMYDARSRVPPEDRWAVAAYIRALQLSQQAGLEDVPPDVRVKLEAQPK